MAAFEEDYKQIKTLQDRASGLSKESSELGAGVLTFEDEVMDGVRAHRAERGVTNLQQDYATTTGRLATGREEIVNRMGKANVDPLDVDRFTAQERGRLLETLAYLAQTMESEQGSVDKVVQAGANKLAAMAEQKRAEAEAAENEARQLLAILENKQMEAQREFERGMSEKEYQLSLQKANSSGGGSDESSNDYYEEIQSLRQYAFEALAEGGKKSEIDSYVNNQIGIISRKYGKTPAQTKSDYGITPKAPAKKTTKKTTTQSSGNPLTNIFKWVMSEPMAGSSATLK